MYDCAKGAQKYTTLEVKIQLPTQHSKNKKQRKFQSYYGCPTTSMSKVVSDFVFRSPGYTTSHSLLCTKIPTLHTYSVVMLYEENGIY